MGRPKGAKDKQPRKMKPTGEARGITKDNNPKLPDGYNTRNIEFMMAIMPEEELDPNDVEEMKRRFLRYLKLCAEYDHKVGNLAAYSAIGITKGQAYDWERSKVNPERASFIKKVRQICGTYRETLMADGKVNPVTGIFWQKNYDEFRDMTEVVVTPNNPLGEEPNLKLIEERYKDNAKAFLPETAESAESAEQLPEGNIDN